VKCFDIVMQKLSFMYKIHDISLATVGSIWKKSFIIVLFFILFFLTHENDIYVKAW
jgi:hypothetical protein